MLPFFVPAYTGRQPSGTCEGNFLHAACASRGGDASERPDGEPEGGFSVEEEHAEGKPVSGWPPSVKRCPPLLNVLGFGVVARTAT